MKPFSALCLNEHDTVRKALQIIDSGKMKVALITNDNRKLIGVISDGDIRRAILAGVDLNHSIQKIIHKNFIYAKQGDSVEKILSLARHNHIQLIPIINDDFELIGIEDINDFLTPIEYENPVVLMVGGLGTRLKPLTDKTPKPLLKVGNKPILETTIENFAANGFKHFILSVNYKHNMISDYFGNGDQMGVHIEYVLEDSKMGTAGALSLMRNKLNRDFFVMNGDVLTKINFTHLLNFHQSHQVDATMCVREHKIQIPYGVVTTDSSHKIQAIDEKPIQRFFVNAGIYMLSPSVLEYVPNNQFFDMPTLFEALVKHNKSTITFPLREYWLDIGQIDEYKKANLEYVNVFG